MEAPVPNAMIIRVGSPSPRKLLALSADIDDLQIATIDLGEISSMGLRSSQLESIFAFFLEESWFAAYQRQRAPQSSRVAQAA